MMIRWDSNLACRQKHLLIGGAGFIGRHVAAGLLSRGHDVIIADRAPIDLVSMFGASANVSAVLMDFTGADWSKLIEGADVVHLYAWTSIPASANANPLGDLTANLGVTLGLLEAMRQRGGGRLLFTSSGGTVYGRTTGNPAREDSPLAPINAYGAGKATAEVYLGLYREMYGLDCRIARVSNPYGAGQDIRRGLGAVMTFLRKALDGEEITIWGDGTTTRDYIHISDLVDALVALSAVPSLALPSPLNIGSGEGLDLNGIISALSRRLGTRLAVRKESPRSFDVPINVLDISRACMELSWKPALSFEQGLDRTIRDVESGALLSTLN